MRRTGRLALVYAGALAGSLLVADRARAFCRITTIQSIPDGEDTTACYDTTHPPVWWRTSCIGLSLQSGASKYASYSTVHDILFDSVLPNWTNAVCPGGGHMSLEFLDTGPVECDEHQDNLYGRNANVVMFHDDTWPYEAQAGCRPGDCCDETIALTTVTFHPSTGELWDGDIEINSACHPISTTLPVPSQSFDLQSILQHETGHFFGLAHPPDPAAIMYYLYSPGTDGKRVVNVDDIAGACTIYEPNGKRSVARAASPSGFVAEGACNASPRNGFTSACVAHGNTPPPSSSSSCHASGGRANPGPASSLLVAAAIALGVRRRRMRR